MLAKIYYFAWEHDRTARLNRQCGQHFRISQKKASLARLTFKYYSKIQLIFFMHVVDVPNGVRPWE